MQFEFTDQEAKTAFDALAAQLSHVHLRRRMENGTHVNVLVGADEFMLMCKGPAGDQTEDWWHFKHSGTRNYVYLRVRDNRVWAPVTNRAFQQGEF